MPDAMIANVARAASSSDRKSANSVRTAGGSGVSRTVTSNATPKQPSDPTNAPRRSYPSLSPAAFPSVTISPSGNTTVRART